MNVVLGLLLAALIGLALGLMGGGGSILTVPILVYVLGFETKAAVAMSLGVVGVTSLVGAVTHWRSGNVRWGTALGFGAVASVGTLGGTQLARLLSGSTQLVIFAGVMLVAAFFMFRSSRGKPVGLPAERAALAEGAQPERAALAEGARTKRPGPAERSGIAATSMERVAHRPRLPILLAGVATGVLTGVVGVGGGFLIVPALVLFAGLPMKRAVGSSLVVIALNALVGFAGYQGQVTLPWGFLAGFTALSIAGILLGVRLVRFVSPRALKQGFSIFLLAMGALILIQNRATLIPEGVTMHPYALSLAGGALIGLSASLLLLFHGRIAGISGIAGNLFTPARGDTSWRASFVGGLLAGGLLLSLVAPSVFGSALGSGGSLPTLALIVAGLLVGFGTRLGNGCTSGHGVCGLSRGSVRSLTATALFMATAILVVFLTRHVLGGF